MKNSLGQCGWLLPVAGLLLLLLLSWPVTALDRIVFASCNDMTFWNVSGSAWVNTVAAWRPEALLWLGDVVYADQRQLLPFFWRPADPARLEASYARLKEHSAYQALRASLLHLWGVWDDHDYGNNDGGADYAHRDRAKQIYLDFVDEPPQSERRTQSGGIYASYLIGPPSRRIKLVLLDVRYNKHGSYGQGDILGAAQWRWLEQELQRDEDWRLLLVASGIQVLSATKPIQEKWATYPASRQRLLTLLQAATLPRGPGQSHRRVILLSGDVHYGEAMRLPSQCFAAPEDPQHRVADLYEVTSSGLTHSCGTAATAWFQPIQEAACSFALNTFMKTAHHVPGSFVALRNWGAIEIDWETQQVSLSIRSVFQDKASQPIDYFTLSLSLNATRDLESAPLAAGVCAAIHVDASLLHLIPFEHWKWLVWSLVICLVLLPVGCFLRCCSSPRLTRRAPEPKTA